MIQFAAQSIQAMSPSKASREKNSKLVLQENEIGICGISILGVATDNKAKMPLVQHAHKDKIEVLIMLDGFQTFEICDVKYTLYTNEALVIMPNEQHLAIESDNKNNSLLWFQIDVNFAENFLNLQKNGIAIYKRISCFSGRKFSLSEELSSGFLKSVFLISTQNVWQKSKGQGLFNFCLLTLFDSKPVLRVLSEDIDYAKQYILTHIKESIDITELMLKTDLKVSEFRKKFEEQIGMSYRDFIYATKIEFLKSTVSDTNESFYNIAYDYHFSSYRFFKQQFIKYTGYSPKKYRKSKKEEK